TCSMINKSLLYFALSGLGLVRGLIPGRCPGLYSFRLSGEERSGVLRCLTFVCYVCCLLVYDLACGASSNKLPVGAIGKNLYSTPINQWLSPRGRQVELPGLRPQALALSPNGRLLAVSGKTAELILIDPVSGRILQHVALPATRTNEPAADVVSSHILKPDKEAEVSYTGLIFSPDASRIYLAAVNGSIKVFNVDTQATVTALDSFDLPPADAPRRKIEIPAGLAIAPDGKRLYVVLNLSNRLAEMD